MSEEQGPRGAGEGNTRPRTPFDNPFFLPVMLWVFVVWFGYDAFLNVDEHMREPFTLWFNRIGFPIVLILAIYFTVKGVREKRAMAERKSGGSSSRG